MSGSNWIYCNTVLYIKPEITKREKKGITNTETECGAGRLRVWRIHLTTDLLNWSYSSSAHQTAGVRMESNPESKSR